MSGNNRTERPDEPGADAWLAQVRSALDESARDVDAATLSRLNRARQLALATAGRSRRASWVWPAALAGAFSVALAVMLVRTPETPLPATPSVAEDFELIAGQDSLELYEELEFYAWLDAQQADG